MEKTVQTRKHREEESDIQNGLVEATKKNAVPLNKIKKR